MTDILGAAVGGLYNQQSITQNGIQPGIAQGQRGQIQDQEPQQNRPQPRGAQVADSLDSNQTSTRPFEASAFEADDFDALLEDQQSQLYTASGPGGAPEQRGSLLDIVA